jgi:MSHA biogenesis protein MshJ
MTSLTSLAEKIDSCNYRERVLILLSVLAVIYLLWTLLIQSSIDKEKMKIVLDIEKIDAEIKEQETQAIVLSGSIAQDPTILKNGEINRLKEKIVTIEEKLSHLSQGLIKAEQLPKILEEVLQRAQNLKIVQLKTFPASELILIHEQSQSLGTGVYKHEVLIRLSANYQQLLALIKEIELLEWKFYWDSLDYTVKQYPNAEIDIHVFTLSSEEGLLGV